jgi:adenylyltransferase/sulfurtransferase
MNVPRTADFTLARARILVVGVGGLGAPAASALAAAGVGTLGLIDPDVVEVSNLHRQLLYGDEDIGAAKVTVAAVRLGALAPRVRIEARRERFGAGHRHLLATFGCVVDGTDSIDAKFLLNDMAVAAGVPLVHGGVVGFRAQLLTILPRRSACFRCVFEEHPPPGEVPSCEEAGVLGPVAALAGALLGAEAIRFLSGDVTSAGQLLTFDLRAGRWRTLPLRRRPDCPACGTVDVEQGRSIVP